MTNEQAAARQAGRDCLVRELVNVLERYVEIDKHMEWTWTILHKDALALLARAKEQQQ